MLTKQGRSGVWALFLALFVASILLGRDIRPRHEEYLRAQQSVSSPDDMTVRGGDALDSTPFQALLPVLLGFRETLAAIMWVQTDDLFHRGEYGPILSLVKRIAFIDPHNLDVYATGAWHMAYNFMDRRLWDDGVDFLEEGVKNNPHVYDLYFELGYMHYDKTKNFARASENYRLAREKPMSTGKPRAPLFVWSAYAHALLHEGNIDRAVGAWRDALAQAELEAKQDGSNFAVANSIAPARHNLYLTQRRLNEREATWLEWQGKRDEALAHWKANIALGEDYLRTEPGRADVRDFDLRDARANVARVEAGKLRTGQPRDMGFDFTWKRTGPRRILVQGKINMPYLGRVTLGFRDVDYADRARRGTTYKMENGTFFQDNLVQIRNGGFRRELQLDKDPADMERDAKTIFPLKSPKYELFVIFNPRVQPHEIQDTIGWSGEGMTDSRYLQEDPSRPGLIEGRQRPLRYLQKTVVLDLKDVQ